MFLIMSTLHYGKNSVPTQKNNYAYIINLPKHNSDKITHILFCIQRNVWKLWWMSGFMLNIILYTPLTMCDWLLLDPNVTAFTGDQVIRGFIDTRRQIAYFRFMNFQLILVFETIYVLQNLFQNTYSFCRKLTLLTMLPILNTTLTKNSRHLDLIPVQCIVLL